MLKGLKTSANNSILAFLSISYYDLVVCFCMLNKMVTPKTAGVTVNLPRKRALGTAAGFLTELHTPRKALPVLTGVWSMQSRRKTKGATSEEHFVMQEQNSKAKWDVPKMTHKKRFCRYAAPDSERVKCTTKSKTLQNWKVSCREVNKNWRN